MRTTMACRMATAAKRPHLVARPPATEVDTDGLIVIRPDIHAAVVSISATYDAAGRQDRAQPDHQGGC